MDLYVSSPGFVAAGSASQGAFWKKPAVIVAALVIVFVVYWFFLRKPKPAKAAKKSPKPSKSSHVSFNAGSKAQPPRQQPQQQQRGQYPDDDDEYAFNEEEYLQAVFASRNNPSPEYTRPGPESDSVYTRSGSDSSGVYSRNDPSVMRSSAPSPMSSPMHKMAPPAAQPPVHHAPPQQSSRQGSRPLPPAKQHDPNMIDYSRLAGDTDAIPVGTQDDHFQDLVNLSIMQRSGTGL